MQNLWLFSLAIAKCAVVTGLGLAALLIFGVEGWLKWQIVSVRIVSARDPVGNVLQFPVRPCRERRRA